MESCSRTNSAAADGTIVTELKRLVAHQNGIEPADVRGNTPVYLSTFNEIRTWLRARGYLRSDTNLAWSKGFTYEATLFVVCEAMHDGKPNDTWVRRRRRG